MCMGVCAHVCDGLLIYYSLPGCQQVKMLLWVDRIQLRGLNGPVGATDPTTKTLLPSSWSIRSALKT